MEDETPAVETEQVADAPGTNDAAPSETAEAPASPPEGYVEQKRYDDLRAQQNRERALWNRAQQGDIEAMRELNLPIDFGDDEPDYGYTEEPDEQEPLTALEQRLAAQEEWAQQQQAQEGMARFQADLDRLNQEKGIDLSDWDRQRIFLDTVQRGDNPDALKAAYEEFATDHAAREKKVIDAYFARKKNAPRVSAQGTGATDEVLPLEASHSDRVRYMMDRLGTGEQ